MDLYGQAISRVLFPAWEGVIRGRPTMEILRSLEQSQWRSAEELEAIQLGAFRRLLFHAYDHVPYYRRLLDEAGVDPRTVRSLDDLHRIPILDREGAQASTRYRGTNAPPHSRIMKRTSGTSGQPLTFGYDLGSEYWRQATKLRGYRWAGYQVGVKTVHYWGVHPTLSAPSFAKKTKITLDRLLKREEYLSCATHADESLLQAVETLRRVRPKVFICYAQAGAELARFINAKGLRDWPDITVLCAAEKVFPADRAAFTEAFGKHVYETYGSREVMLMGMECEAHDGMHLSMENLIVEVIVREGEKTRAARPGEIGEVVVTDLHNYGMPFIRYLNGDLAQAGEQGTCSCGRGLEKISNIEGRVVDALRDAQGGRVTGMMIAVFLANVGHAINQFQVVQHVDGSLTFKYVPGPEFSEQAHQYLRTSMEGCLKGYPVKMDEVPEILPGENGKRRVIIIEK